MPPYWILRRPDLAGFVRSFTLSTTNNCRDLEEHISLEIVEVDQAFKSAVNALHLTKEEENSWLRELSDSRYCNPDLILALLLLVLLKVERLGLDLDVGY